MPYLIPDDALMQALQTAVLRGVEVTLVVPLQMDQVLVCLAQRSYYDELLDSGVRICRYGKRFLHAKHLSIDDRIAWIGSSNLDIRSFALNAEIIVLLYDSHVCSRLAEEQRRYLRDGEMLELAAWRQSPRAGQVRREPGAADEPAALAAALSAIPESRGRAASRSRAGRSRSASRRPAAAPRGPRAAKSGSHRPRPS